MKSTVMLPKFTLTICVHFLSMAFLTFFDFLFLFFAQFTYVCIIGISSLL